MIHSFVLMLVWFSFLFWLGWYFECGVVCLIVIVAFACLALIVLFCSLACLIAWVIVCLLLT